MKKIFIDGGSGTVGLQLAERLQKRTDIELLKLDNNKEIVIVRGRKPFICNKYDYSKHIEASKMEDMTIEEQREKFKDNVENEKNKQQPKKVKYSFKDF